MEDVLGLLALLLTMLMTLSVVIWLCCSIVGSVVKTRRRLENPRYDALLRENKRLKSFLTEAEEENSHLRSRLRKIHYSKRIDRESNIRQRAA